MCSHRVIQAGVSPASWQRTEQRKKACLGTPSACPWVEGSLRVHAAVVVLGGPSSCQSDGWVRGQQDVEQSASWPWHSPVKSLRAEKNKGFSATARSLEFGEGQRCQVGILRFAAGILLFLPKFLCILAGGTGSRRR